MSYTYSFTPASKFTLGGIMTKMEQAADLQLEHYGPSQKELFYMDLAFVVATLDVFFANPLKINQEAIVTTFPYTAKGYIFPRAYKLEQNGTLLATAYTTLALINLSTKKLHPDTDYHPGFDFDTPTTLPPKRVLFPKEEYETIGKAIVPNYLCDQNGHLHNTYYIDFFAPYVQKNAAKIRHIFIHYYKEAREGVSLKIQRCVTPEATYLKTILPNGSINAELAFFHQAEEPIWSI